MASDQLVHDLGHALPRNTIVSAREGHLYVWRPDLLKTPLDEIHLLSVSGKNGLLLGYGATQMNLPGSVRVLIFDEAGRVVTGFYSLPDVAEHFAEERTQDFTDALGPGFTYSIIEK